MFRDSRSANEKVSPVRLVPGSHLEPLHGELVAMGVGSHTTDLLPSHVCASEPGDVVMFDMRCFHASFNGRPNRRMCTVRAGGGSCRPADASHANAMLQIQIPELRAHRYHDIVCMP
eukprot:SAG22_NODE_1806_length_3531_cov_2.206294_2_plen_117_part_00